MIVGNKCQLLMSQIHSLLIWQLSFSCTMLPFSLSLSYCSMLNSLKFDPAIWAFLFLIFWQDDDPYVRKTAAICVAKLYDINAELVEDRGFLESLKDLISDNNPMVVANAVAALAEIQDNSNTPIFEITSHTLSKLLTALNECTE